MVEVDLFQILIIPIISVILVPVYYFGKLYYKTKLSDFIIFAITYSMVPIVGLSYFMLEQNELLILHQVIQISLLTAYALVMVLIIRIVWERKPTKIHYLGFGSYIFLVFLILLFQLDDQPNSVNYGFMTLDHTYSPYHPKGASTKINEKIIYSTSHYIIGLFFILFVLAVTLYGIHNFDLVSPSVELLQIKDNWFKLLSIHTLGWLFYFPWLEQYAGFGQLLIFISHLGTAYLIIRNPEFVLINQAQIVVAYQIYESVIKSQDGKIPEVYGVKSIVRYLKNLPTDLVDELNLR